MRGERNELTRGTAAEGLHAHPAARREREETRRNPEAESPSECRANVGLGPRSRPSRETTVQHPSIGQEAP